MIKPDALSIYVHIPWCIRKCPYCDFNSHLKNEQFDEERYVRAIIDDIKQRSNQYTSLNSVFFGGGTPSLFKPDSFATILDTIHDRFSISENTEITIEANPGTADSDYFKGYRDIGINRISIGAQTLNDVQLKRIGRIHSCDDILKALNMAVTANFKRINADIMYALPEQTIADVRSDIKKLLEYPIDHLSAYQLTIEPNTHFFKRPPMLPSDDLAIDMQATIIDISQQQGFKRYEVSAYAKEGGQSTHNLNYWNFGDYLGFGAGAHAKITKKGCIQRTTRFSSPQKYMNGLTTRDYIENKIDVMGDELFIEYCMNTLRLVNGFSIADCIAKTSINGSRLHDIMLPLIESGQINFGQTRVRTTEQGYRFLDDVLTKIMYNTEKFSASDYE